MMNARAARGRLRKLQVVCLALPETTEHTEGTPVLDHHARLAAVFRVDRRSFAWFLDNHHGDGLVAVACKTMPGRASRLVERDGERYYLPPYLRRSGWVGLRLDHGDVDWREVAELVEDSYRLVAPPRLARRLLTLPRGNPVR
jgi:predicted DNA-binding protein (MmcQ/YjbR family)